MLSILLQRLIPSSPFPFLPSPFALSSFTPPPLRLPPLPIPRAAVYTGGSSETVRVLEGMSPVFTVEGLAAGGDYVVTITAINRKGTSPPVSLEAYTLKVAENRMSEFTKSFFILCFFYSFFFLFVSSSMLSNIKGVS